MHLTLTPPAGQSLVTPLRVDPLSLSCCLRNVHVLEKNDELLRTLFLLHGNLLTYCLMH